MSQAIAYALSLKQPWAALVAHGLKVIEVRRWPTTRRGRILIHAARVSDQRPEAWVQVPEELLEAARLKGGIVGAAQLTSCIGYRSQEAFLKDQSKHLNRAEWFEGPIMYGFTFSHAEVLPFKKYPGWMRFFPVEEKRAAR
jgi:hypothetical protein